MNTIYDILLQLPIFQGIEQDKMAALVEKTRFHFLKFKEGDRIVKRGEECTHIKFIISGNVRSEIVTRNEKIMISEVLSAPSIVAPNHVFGLNTFYPSTLIADGPVNIMQVDKATFLTILQTDTIFLINLLNIISRRSQKNTEMFLSLSTGDLKEKLAFWILSFTHRKSSNIRVVGRIKDMYSFFGVPRSVFMNGLNELKEKGILDYNPREIFILDRMGLKDILYRNDEIEDEDF